MTNQNSDWREGFKRAFIDALVKNGSPVRDDPSIYGWVEYDSGSRVSRGSKRDRVKSVGIDYERTTYAESSWHEFMGTFYEGDTRVTGIDVYLVLLDGSEMNWRYAGTVADLITAVIGMAGEES